jgi:hypothetical protein
MEASSQNNNQPQAPQQQNPANEQPTNTQHLASNKGPVVEKEKAL